MRNGSHLTQPHSRSVMAGWVDDKLSPCLGGLGGDGRLTMTEASTLPRSDWAEKPPRDTLATPVLSVGKGKLGYEVG